VFFHLDERRSADRSACRRKRSQPALPGDQPRAGQAYAGSGAAGEARGALLAGRAGHLLQHLDLHRLPSDQPLWLGDALRLQVIVVAALVGEHLWRSLKKRISPFVQQRLTDVPFPANLGMALLAPKPFRDGFKFEFWTEGAPFCYVSWSTLRYDTLLLGCPECPPHYSTETRWRRR